MSIQKDYLERVYAGWLGKIIGVRYGAPIEGWSYQKIRKTLGLLDGYIVDYKDFAADDDTNGPIFFLRSLTDYGINATAEDMGNTWLNYAPYEHGFYWWGGYGKSTEHTAYLNLRAGIKAPHSGSVMQNGKTVAEQIGGQIFIDTWGLIAPGNPKLAAEYAEKAASVSHGGNGIYGGAFIAAAIAAAFAEQDIERIIAAGLYVIPSDCEYRRMANDVIAFWKKHPTNWEDCFNFVFENYGYDKYPGACHIIPNSAVILLSLLYSEGSFDKALNICNMCGWDTDCNVANVGCIMGVRNGLQGIDYDKWRKPINDFYVCSSVVGSLNIMDIPSDAKYIAALGYKIAGETLPQNLVSDDVFDFSLPGSTHGFRVLTETGNTPEYTLKNDGNSLKLIAKLSPGDGDGGTRLFHKTYYGSKDFHDSRYDPAFSPLFYNGQTISCKIRKSDECVTGLKAAIYVQNSHTGKLYEGVYSDISEVYSELSYTANIPKDACINQVGVIFRSTDAEWFGLLCVNMTDFAMGGKANYEIDFAKEKNDVWHGLHQEVSQFTYLKGIWTIEDGELSGSVSDFGECYTGSHKFGDLCFAGTLIPQVGQSHSLNVCVQGAMRSYAIGLRANNKLVIEKNNCVYKVLAETDFAWQHGTPYRFTITVKAGCITVCHDGKELLSVTDDSSPWLNGQVGASLRQGSHCHFKDFHISEFLPQKSGKNDAQDASPLFGGFFNEL